MNIITLLIVLAVVGFLLWLLLTYVPMPQPFPKIIIGVVVFALILYLLSFFGLIGGSGSPVIRVK